MEEPAWISMNVLKTFVSATEESVPTPGGHIRVCAPADLFRGQILRHALISTSASRTQTSAETENVIIQLGRFSADAKRDTQLNLGRTTSAPMTMSVISGLMCVM